VTLDLNGHAVRGGDSTGAIVMGVSRDKPVDQHQWIGPIHVTPPLDVRD
jgi:hypothetical protein